MRLQYDVFLYQFSVNSILFFNSTPVSIPVLPQTATTGGGTGGKTGGKPSKQVPGK